jgi:hypothetical protein
MYLWALLSRDVPDPPAVRGITDDLDRAMRVTEPYLIDERASLCRIIQVRYAMSVPSMDTCYVPTGRAWDGRRDNRGGVAWQEIDVPVVPATGPRATRWPGMRQDGAHATSDLHRTSAGR